LESKEPLPDKKEDKKKIKTKSKDKEAKPEKRKKDIDLLEEISQPVDSDSKGVGRKSDDIKPKSVAPQKPYQTTSQSKKKFFSRQTFGNAKKIFRRKSI